MPTSARGSDTICRIVWVPVRQSAGWLEACTAKIRLLWPCNKCSNPHENTGESRKDRNGEYRSTAMSQANVWLPDRRNGTREKTGNLGSVFQQSMLTP